MNQQGKQKGVSVGKKGNDFLRWFINEYGFIYLIVLGMIFIIFYIVEMLK